MLAEWIYATFKARVSRATLARLHNLPSSYFSHVDLSATKRRRVKFPQFERELREFFFQNEAKTATADDVLLLKAHELAERLGIDSTQLRFSNGWLQSFKKRNGIRSHVLHGEGGAAEGDAVRDARLELQELVAQFAPDDVFNFDETALFYRLAPNRPLATTIRKGKIKEKQRLTLSICCNATGSDKLNPIVIGIIWSFKARYRKYFVRWCLDALEANITRKLNVLEAVQFSIDAWAGVTPTTITNCWVKTRILGGTMLGRVRADANYIEAVSGNEMEELTAILSKWEGAVSTSEYLAVDEDVPADEPDVIVDEAAGSDAVSQEEEEEEEHTIQPAIALRHCMELSAFLLQCGEQTDRERRSLQTVTALVRETTVKAKRQRIMRDFFTCTT
ncbi:uncharacterized protein IUM83_15760 [Phytophthora cinnamomi]|uniref:uncharacterized protein n=1 Tax=Phytophthora cinnamomi TaxID=4785 RepID=UPI003559D3D3|nr:hypothetical protein IUM83_15760 [Phytophthora cinnamomi]